jgi:serine/threonine-protein kinase
MLSYVMHSTGEESSVPDHLGPYELRGELGRGAMAVVWRAFDPNLEREVAIKEPVIPHGTEPAVAQELSDRFVREGKAIAALQHPGIVTVHDAGVYDGRPAMVMELVDGTTLGDLLAAEKRLDTPTAISVASQLLDALAYAHDRGIVHRDVKPDNVFVTHDGRIKLADFGIARIADKTRFTQEGTVMGTPGYMPPEQVRGMPVDARADGVGG